MTKLEWLFWAKLFGKGSGGGTGGGGNTETMYTVRFLNGDTVLQEGLVAEGEIPVYMGTEPIDSSGNGDAFIGWIPDISAVTGDIDYVASFGSLAKVNYVLSSDGTYYSAKKVSGDNGKALVIQSEYNGLPVKEIAGSGFYNCSNITSATLSDSVTTLNDASFQSCKNLVSIKLSNNLKVIKDESFSQCVSLASVTIPDSVTEIGLRAFDGCTSLESVEILNNPSLTIKGLAFYNCTNLKSVRLPATPPVIGGGESPFTSVPAEALTFYVPTGSLSTYESATKWCDWVDQYTFVEEDR